MNTFLYLFYFLLSVHGDSPMKQESVTFINPIQYSDSSAVNDSSTFYITYYKDYILYELPKTLNRNSAVNPGHSVVYEYAISKKDVAEGYVLQSLTDTHFVKRDIKTFLNGRANNLLQSDSLIKYCTKNSIIKKSGSNWVYHYAFPVPGIDSVYLSVEKKRNVYNYSFAPTLDSAYSGKVFKICFLASKFVGANADYLNRFLETSLTIQNVPITSKEEKIALFRRIFHE